MSSGHLLCADRSGTKTYCGDMKNVAEAACRRRRIRQSRILSCFYEGFSCEDKHAMCGANMQRFGALYWCVCAPKEACGTCRHC